STQGRPAAVMVSAAVKPATPPPITAIGASLIRHPKAQRQTERAHNPTRWAARRASRSRRNQCAAAVPADSRALAAVSSHSHPLGGCEIAREVVLNMLPGVTRRYGYRASRWFG